MNSRSRSLLTITRTHSINIEHNDNYYNAALNTKASRVASFRFRRQAQWRHARAAASDSERKEHPTSERNGPSVENTDHGDRPTRSTRNINRDARNPEIQMEKQNGARSVARRWARLSTRVSVGSSPLGRLGERYSD